jgi:hypothetical protein
MIFQLTFPKLQAPQFQTMDDPGAAEQTFDPQHLLLQELQLSASR